MKDITRVSLGLFAAFAVHDGEELLTMAPTSQELLARMPAWAPIPKELRERGISQTHVNVGIGVMAALVATASAAGIRTQGRSAWFRGGVLAFGLHGFTHLVSAIVARGYTTGVATAPTIVIPYWLWARSVLKRNGVSQHDAKSTAIAVSVFPLLIVVHALTRLALGRKSVGGSRTSRSGAERRG